MNCLIENAVDLVDFPVRECPKQRKQMLGQSKRVLPLNTVAPRFKHSRSSMNQCKQFHRQYYNILLLLILFKNRKITKVN